MTTTPAADEPMADFKPGDMALVDSWRGNGQLAFRTQRGPVLSWCVLDGTDTRGLEDFEVGNARRVVLIDPTDRSAAVRLGQRIGSLVARPGDDISRIIGEVEIWLRELAGTKPPKEPTDPRTRVTDRRENIWRLLADGDWVCTSGPDIGEYIVWSRLSAERGPLAVEAVTA